MSTTATTTPRYVPFAGCSGCPHRTVCSEARQRVHDPVIEVGRHYLCDFYGPITAAVKAAAVGSA